jgi:hypothetical protein
MSSLVTAARSGAGGRDLASAVSDRDLATGSGFLAGVEGGEWRLDVELAPGRRYRSLVVVTAEEKAVDLAVEARGAGTAPPIPVGRIRRSGRVTLVALGDREVARVTIRPTARLGPLVAIQEIWANPTDGDR